MQVLRLRRFVIVCHLTSIVSITSLVLVDEKNKTFSRCNELKQATSRFLIELSTLFFGNVASGTPRQSVKCIRLKWKKIVWTEEHKRHKWPHRETEAICVIIHSHILMRPTAVYCSFRHTYAKCYIWVFPPWGFNVDAHNFPTVMAINSSTVMKEDNLDRRSWKVSVTT